MTKSFKPNRPPDYSEDELIKEIQRVIHDEFRGVVPSQTRFLQCARISYWTIKSKFGTYQNAIKKAGFSYEDSREKFTPERIVSDLRSALNIANGYSFTFSFYKNNGGLYSVQTIKSILKATTWASVLEIIGAKPKPHFVRISAHAQRLRTLGKLNNP